VDENSQVQTLERNQPILPMKLGQPERRSWDYWRHGTLNLFAALNVKTSEVLGEMLLETPQQRVYRVSSGN
jgi:hypothetical protein